ncbi:DEAD/DEAH box helicase [Streptococcus sp. E17BB]|uniref:DEAD/DEAH box helicase n=1 Tax=Streptococcus sp. E17BB TaxID=3278714 RepID=UPI00359D6B9C
MAKLMPSWVRQEGVALYQTGQVQLQDSNEQSHQLMVGDAEVTYADDDYFNHCNCDFFATKGYCAHLAGAEHFVKHHLLSEATPKVEETVQQSRSEYLFASRFLDELEELPHEENKYCLSVIGERPYGQQLLWTIKIQRLPDQRSYVIRDIPAFLSLVRDQKHYQIGKNYYEQLSTGWFDSASQEVLHFLNRLASSDSSTFFPTYGRHLFLPGGFFAEGLEVLGKLSSFSLTLLAGQVLTQPNLKPLAAEYKLFQFEVRLELDHIGLVIKERYDLSLFEGQYLYREGVFYALTDSQQRLFKALSSLPIGADWHKTLIMDLTEQGRLAEHLFDFSTLGPVQAPLSFAIKDFEPEFIITQEDHQLRLDLVLHYDELTVKEQSEFMALPFTSHPKKKREIDRTLVRLGFAPTFSSYRALPKQAELYQFFEQELPQLRCLGQVTLSPAVEALWQVVRPRIAFERAGGLLEVNFDFSDLSPTDIEQAVISLQEQEPYFISRSGQVVVFDDEVKRISQTLLNLRAKHLDKSRFQVSNLASFQLKDALSSYDRVNFSDELQSMTTHLSHPETFELGELPISATLRGYQQRGVQWLSVLDHYGFGGVLADDMGLGKTLQTIAFLSRQLCAGQRALILAPSSLVYNWQEEFAKFLPEVAVSVVQGTKAQREASIRQQDAVLLTSYHSFRQDLLTYQDYHFDYLILDEAQVLKNSQTKIAQALRDFPVSRCFALSGTPIENRLLEIWSIFQIVLPGLFTSKTQFNQLSAQAVARIIRPFLLRRRKEEVLPELPDMTEITYHNDMSDGQKTIYLAQLERMQQRVLQTSQAEFARDKIEILSGITRLRQICNTPQLFMPYEGSSGKLDGLRDLLVQLKDNGHRVLIFSQFRGMLTLIEEQLQELGLNNYILTGSTPPRERQEMTTAFNKGSRDVFLMSLKAGGVGLNLTGADTVILVDLWWNPAVELQAIGRAHRLGQDKPVQVYRLITKGSIEEKILALQDNKRHLIKDVLDGDVPKSSLTLAEIKEILGISE